MTKQLPRRLAAVMFTDVVGYTAMMQADEEAAREVRLRHREALEAAIPTHGGELVQYLGDGSLSTFPSTVGAVSAAVEIQNALREDVPLRIGIHQGEIAFDEQGIYGDSVNVAARIMDLGTAGSVVVSDKAQAELDNQRGLTTASLGQFHLKNVRRPPTVYAVKNEGLIVPTRRDLLSRSDSTIVYSGVTRHWPKLAGAGLLVAVLLGLSAGDLGSALSFQSYVFAWAGVTAGLWFLFDLAECTMSEQTRSQVAAWLCDSDWRPGLSAIPAQFTLLFDRVFGTKHWSLRCLGRSALASLAGVTISFLIFWTVTGESPAVEPTSSTFLESGELSVPGGGRGLMGQSDTISTRMPWPVEDLAGGVFLVLLGAVLLNLIPDYISLLETRWLLRRLSETPALRILLLDAGLTFSIALTSFVVAVLFLTPLLRPIELVPRMDVVTAMQDLLLLEPSVRLGSELKDVVDDPSVFILVEETLPLPAGLFLYSTFFTSVWLWLYAASVLLSRVLLRMNSGVGFLLRATDVERQPFRSMGFLSVIIVSGLFMLGLPFVLL